MKMTYNRLLCLVTALCLLLGLVLGASGVSVAEETAATAIRQSGDDGPQGTPPEGFPGGTRPDGTPPAGMGEPPSGGMGGGPGGVPGGASADIEYAGAVEITSRQTQEDETYASETADESALLIATSDAVVITNPTVTKSGSSNGGDSCNFYGLNAAVLIKDGAQVTLTGGTVTSDASGANGVFCYGGNGGQNGAKGDGTTLTIRNTAITTKGSGSGGIMTTGGGVTYAYDLTVNTSGQSSAAIRTDRGGGTVYVNGGSYTSNGLGSPAIYSTAEIHVSNATLTSNLSEGVCIEGKNSIELVDCDLVANNTQMNGNATFLDTIMIYQSMSGDADSGTSAFSMTGGSLTSRNGHVFHVTNTNALITLSGVTVVNEDSEGVLLSVCDDGWTRKRGHPERGERAAGGPAAGGERRHAESEPHREHRLHRHHQRRHHQRQGGRDLRPGGHGARDDGPGLHLDADRRCLCDLLHRERGQRHHQRLHPLCGRRGPGGHEIRALSKTKTERKELPPLCELHPIC